ncbi:MAG TPA: hypothetical protein VMG41_15065 [Gemmatimonadales bacterium]|nr:hypothetical protein [Gemmatimonadales bacterium]
MLRAERGFSTVECLVAVTLVSVGVLGALGTLSAAIRLGHRGDHAAAGARLLVETMGRLQADLGRANGRCAPLAGDGAVWAGSGERVDWSLVPVAGGLTVRLTLAYPTESREVSDTSWSFLPCFA